MNPAILAAILGGVFSIAAIYFKKRDEARSINIAILAEVKRLIIVLRKHKEWWDRQIEIGDTDLPLVPFPTPVFDEREQDLGQLNPAIVETVIRFYGAVKYINSFQAKKSEFPKEKSDRFVKQYGELLDEVYRTYGPRLVQEIGSYGLKTTSEALRELGPART